MGIAIYVVCFALLLATQVAVGFLGLLYQPKAFWIVVAIATAATYAYSAIARTAQRSVTFASATAVGLALGLFPMVLGAWPWGIFLTVTMTALTLAGSCLVSGLAGKLRPQG